MAVLAPEAERPSGERASSHAGMVFIRGGAFEMGTPDGFAFEGPVHQVSVSPFWIDEHEVTVGEFAAFVKATGYVTDAERFGWSAVFRIDDGRWVRVEGADWRSPEGPNSEAKSDEPVTQVSWQDALNYARWAGKRLPTEAEWECAARGGIEGKRYAWGDELRPHNKCAANFWQGNFPFDNSREDGYQGRAPVGRFPANSYGLYDMAGNVWEWCADWFDKSYYGDSAALDPQGPAFGLERSIRGGSWMCSETYCQGYRVAARSHATPDSAMNNLGFRCVRSLK